jgi:peroxiredoxin
MKKAGDRATEFTLSDAGGTPVPFSSDKPTIFAFFKVSCPTCQYTFPFLERLSQAHKNDARVIGISQDPAGDTREFATEFGVTFPIALDSAPAYKVSNAYQITTVPSIFVVQDGKITYVTEGWAKSDFEQLHAMLTPSGSTPAALFKPNEDVRDFKAG